MRTLHGKRPRLQKGHKKHGRIRGLVSRGELVALYHEEGLSLEDIAQKFGVTRVAVSYLLKEYGIPARGKSKARILAFSKGKLKGRSTARLHESLFSEWSQPMAYLLGYIFTDGSLSRVGNSFRVQIASIDREHLEKLAAILGEEVKVQTRRQSKEGFSGKEDRYLYVIQFTRPEMIQDLHRLGLTEHKSLTMRFPDVPEEFLRDFIRGCWDGDGSVYLEGGTKLSATFVTGSLSFIQAMRDRLNKRGFGRLTIHTRYPDRIKTKNRSYSIRISGRHAAEFCDFLYDGVPDNLLLARKWLIYNNWQQEDAARQSGPDAKARLSRQGSSSPIGGSQSAKLCAGTTSTGLECALRPMPGSLFCRKHQSQASEPTASVSED